MRPRSMVKTVLAACDRRAGHPSGATLLIYHRVGGGTSDELDLPVESFRAQMDVLAAGDHEVLSLDAALDRLDAGDDAPSVVLTFDDGFAETYEHAYPQLSARGLPFTLYLAGGLVGGSMRWEGSNAASQGSRALGWGQLDEMVGSGLCTVANHTFTHAGPGIVDIEELDLCSDEIERNLGQRPAHFAWTWGVPVPRLLPAIRERFRSASTGDLGRNTPDTDRHALVRVPVRASDPMRLFHAKLTGSLRAERAYEAITGVAKLTRIRPTRG